MVEVNREAIEESRKSLSIPARALCKRSDVMWDILLDEKETAEKLTGSILTTKSVRM